MTIVVAGFQKLWSPPRQLDAPSATWKSLGKKRPRGARGRQAAPRGVKEGRGV